MKLCYQDKTLCLSSNQDLILYQMIQTFNVEPVKIPHFKSLMTRKQARWPHIFIAFL